MNRFTSFLSYVFGRTLKKKGADAEKHSTVIRHEDYAPMKDIEPPISAVKEGPKAVVTTEPAKEPVVEQVAEVVEAADEVVAAAEDATAEPIAAEEAAESVATAEASESAEGAESEAPAKPATTISESGLKLSSDASGFVDVSKEVPDALLDIRYYSTYNFVGSRIDGYEEPLAFLTKEAAAALKAASDEAVEKGYRLKIFDAYRPHQAVAHFVNWARNTADDRMKKYFYPDPDKEALFTLGYVAERSGHSRGSTVDLTLFDMASQKELDMGGTFDYFGQESHPDYEGITPEQYANRMLLRDIMAKHGFKPLVEEWWHFTLENEPYPDTYFTFPVNSDSLEGNGE